MGKATLDAEGRHQTDGVPYLKTWPNGQSCCSAWPFVQVILKRSRLGMSAEHKEFQGAKQVVSDLRARCRLRRILILFISGFVIVGATRSDAQILHRKKKVNKSTSADNTAEPDKILYAKAMEDIKHGRHEVGRLNLQTLINTYPDSEYLAKAKLAIADSFYKEGGTASMTQAIQAYKDFDVFFPFLPEAPYAQLQVAMAHYRQMEKPDRDRTQAREAEDEFQTFLQKYPKDPLVPQAEQRLREVQEVLAEADYRIGYFYYVKGDRRAAASRLISLTTRYPLYSRSDRALWMLGDIFEKSERKDAATQYYAQIVRNYPMSGYVSNAKSKLTTLGAPVPQADPKALAWMTAEQKAPHPHSSLVKKPLGILKSGPGTELQTAARVGAPNLEPESTSNTGIDILKGGNQSRIGGGSRSGIVATITPGVGSGTTSEAENTAPASDGSPSSNAATAEANPAAATTSNSASPTTDTGATEAAPKTDQAATGAAQTSDGASVDGTADTSQNGRGTKNPKESTSKKKKGLRKIVPW
jgi:outer membrane protein assembly factor BamD